MIYQKLNVHPERACLVFSFFFLPSRGSETLEGETLFFSNRDLVIC